ncbi:glucans biosynthesis glucosyltransferase MdoH [Roseococcus sp. SYP-B2431]|uniref:glucans biosynthesis glucosyltransferase MdoH n=1 Tax=Roseococcus sp. SYP-B2431 TaxID=2496640 RepID=UPI00103C9771|nr:glucans biosynthesis glucosyltransferase MdoH [Roseococcus sp. SYP-B2431]TCH96148.1 glucans biosynthesis glucosyltransferase MdoH [Roseococcus sp. SYP-B2431]
MDGLSRALPGFELLPPEWPMAMPAQDLSRAPRPGVTRRPSAPPLMWLRRLLVVGSALALTGIATAEMSLVLGLSRWSVMGVVMTAIFAMLFVWIALAFTSALAGLVSMALASDPLGLRAPVPRLRSRTALLMPVYNESVAHWRATLAAMRASFEAAGASGHFDIFVLSDTTDPAIRDAEAEAAMAFGQAAGPAVFYRHRTDNKGRKAGNIEEWVRRFGGAYEQFLILDADSLMEAGTIVTLSAAMERHDDVGLIQTLPLLHGGETLFARLQQFAGQVYGPLIAQGLAWWSGADSNYWGHNAMIRTRAFASAAGLPRLPGRKPFGGDILSHDFVEAALMRRAGWAIHLAPLTGGSYEQGPPTLPDLAVRDRRWCQGNLQHAAVIGTAGLHPLSRLHMATGIAAYLSAPFWLGFLVLGLAVSLQARFIRPEYFPKSHALFPQWPVVDPERALWVFAGTFLLLLAPKFMALIALVVARRGRGGIRVLASGVLEILVSSLLSPVTMLTQAQQVAGILLGRDGGWSAQRREGEAITFRAALRLARAHLALGVVLTALAVAINPLLAAWMAPVLVGLLAAPWLIAWTASTRLAAWLRARGLLTVPTEEAPSDVLLRAAREHRAARAMQAAPEPRGMELASAS